MFGGDADDTIDSRGWQVTRLGTDTMRREAMVATKRACWADWSTWPSRAPTNAVRVVWLRRLTRESVQSVRYWIYAIAVSCLPFGVLGCGGRDTARVDVVPETTDSTSLVYDRSVDPVTFALQKVDVVSGHQHL